MNTTNNDAFEPQFFNLNQLSDQQEFDTLLKDKPYIRLCDEIDSQVAELIKLQQPNKLFNPSQLQAEVDNFFSTTDRKKYGVWVYYSWVETLVHLLPEQEFIEVRTNRNKNKIHADEIHDLASKKVGIIGLSVGQSVATTIALERIAGEIRIADFDTLELSNYNRIRSTLRHLGVNKTISVAREIAEIDPFLKVICFVDGITEQNIDTFMTEGGKLDMVIEESDGLGIKILARQKAKSYGIPVLMEASERGVLDVERFDLEPNRPILHGYLDGMDIEAAKTAKTNEEKMPYMMQIVGIDIISDKMKSSMLEIGQSLTTWPQLASAVVYGGGMTADVCRRIFLKQFSNSGRYIVDIADIVNDQVAPYTPPVNQSTSEDNRQMDFTSLVKSEEANDYLKLNHEKIAHLVKVACQAPSGGNSQPWKWIYKGNCLHLFHEIDISTQWLDYKHRGAHISFGAALENLKLEAYHQNLEVIEYVNEDEDELLIAKIYFKEASPEYLQQHKEWYTTFYASLNKRLTSRYLGNEAPISHEDTAILKQIAEQTPQAELKIIQQRSELEKAAQIVGKSERLMLTHKTAHEEFYNEIKWNAEDAERTRVGIDVRTVELTATELAGFNLARRWSVVENLNKWGGGGAFEKLGIKMTKSASGLALLTMPNYTKKDFIEGGRTLQRVWIKANELGLSVQPMSAAIFLFARLIHGQGDGLTPKMISELNEIRKTHNALFNTSNDKGEIFLFRLFYAKAPQITSYRKQLSDVFEIID